MRFTADQIEGEATKGWHTDRLYRRVWLDNASYDGVVRYDPALENLVEDVRVYIAEALNRMALRASHSVVCSWLWRPVDIPLPR